MTRETIQEIVNQYAQESKRQIGYSIKAVVFYVSCTREEYDDESDIDL